MGACYSRFLAWSARVVAERNKFLFTDFPDALGLNSTLGFRFCRRTRLGRRKCQSRYVGAKQSHGGMHRMLNIGVIHLYGQMVIGTRAVVLS